MVSLYTYARIDKHQARDNLVNHSWLKMHSSDIIAGMDKHEVLILTDEHVDCNNLSSLSYYMYMYAFTWSFIADSLFKLVVPFAATIEIWLSLLYGGHLRAYVWIQIAPLCLLSADEKWQYLVFIYIYQCHVWNKNRNCWIDNWNEFFGLSNNENIYGNF